MLRQRTKGPSPPPSAKGSPATSAAGDGAVEWEVRPGGMLVQKRDADSPSAAAPTRSVRVRVKYGTAHHEVSLSSQSTFGELKKLLSARTGLHPDDQKLMYKGKERDSAAYLDFAGVKDRSKMVLVEDPTAQAKRCLEMRRAAKMEKASKSISEISLEVDKLAAQVSELEGIISKGGKVAESAVLSLIELLMMQLIKLDGIVADGDLKLQRRMQEKRVQKYVETLDALKIKNAMPTKENGQMPTQQQLQHQRAKNQSLPPPPPSVVVTTKWETFDSLFSPTASAATSAGSSATASSAASSNPTPRFDWELF